MALCWSLDEIGPICRAVVDAVQVLSLIKGFDSRDTCSTKATRPGPPPVCACTDAGGYRRYARPPGPWSL